MHLILTGATGLVGSAVLDGMLGMKEVTKISVLSRRPVKMADNSKDPRVNVIIHKNFEEYDAELLDRLKGAEGCVWAIGISQTQVGKEEYIKITKDFALAAATAFQTLPPPSRPFNFVYVSGRGATQTPGRFTPIFGVVKGETETALAGMQAANPNIFHGSSARPGWVDMGHHDAIKGYAPARTAMLALGDATLGKAIRVGMKTLWSPSKELGLCLTEMAMGRWDEEMLKGGPGVLKVGDGDGGFRILENEALRRMQGLDK